MLKQRVVLISGLPGSGKTSSCLNILQCYEREDTKNNVLVFEDLDEVNTSDIPEHTAILLDDCFEKWFYLHDKQDLDRNKLQNISQLVKTTSNVYVLFTLRECTFEAYGSFIINQLGVDEKHIIHMGDIKLNYEEALQITYIFIKMHGVTVMRNASAKFDEIVEGTVKKCLEKKTKVGHVEALEIYCITNKQLLIADGKFFNDPQTFLVRTFILMSKAMDAKERWEYCSLMYLLLKGGKVRIEDGCEIGLLVKITKHLNFAAEGRECLNFESKYMLKEDDVVTFQHSFIMRTFLFHLLMDTQQTQFVINNCSHEVLLRYMRCKKDEKEKDIHVITPKLFVVNFKSILAKRLAKEYCRTSDVNILKYISMEDRDYNKEFATALADEYQK